MTKDVETGPFSILLMMETLPGEQMPLPNHHQDRIRYIKKRVFGKFCCSITDYNAGLLRSFVLIFGAKKCARFHSFCRSFFPLSLKILLHEDVYNGNSAVNDDITMYSWLLTN